MNGGRESLWESFRQVMASLPPAPRFDRFAVRDMRPFDGIPRRDDRGPLLGAALPPALVGIPVVVDNSVEVGVIELRKGDEIVDRIVLSELRA